MKPLQLSAEIPASVVKMLAIGRSVAEIAKHFKATEQEIIAIKKAYDKSELMVDLELADADEASALLHDTELPLRDLHDIQRATRKKHRQALTSAPSYEVIDDKMRSISMAIMHKVQVEVGHEDTGLLELQTASNILNTVQSTLHMKGSVQVHVNNEGGGISDTSRDIFTSQLSV